MRTLLLQHREISSCFITLFVFSLITLACGNFYKSTHQFSQRGNAPISLKIVANSPKTLKTPAPKTKSSKSQKAPSKISAVKKTQPKTSKPLPAPLTTQPQISQKSIAQEEKQEVLAQENQITKQVKSNESKDSEITQETQEEIELIASIEGKHFELYKQVHGAILKNVFYPKKARYKRLAGVVIVEFVLEENGSITQKKIIQSSGYALLDESALKTLNQTQFPTTPKRYRFRVPLRYG